MKYSTGHVFSFHLKAKTISFPKMYYSMGGTGLNFELSLIENICVYQTCGFHFTIVLEENLM